MNAWRVLACLCLWPAALAVAWANPHRLDDSGSYTVPPQVQMQWRELPPGMAGADAMEASLRVNVRIDTRLWVGRSGRVYMALARDEGSRVEASWTTQGRLQAGRVVSGERALVWAGSITAPTLVDQLLVRLRTGTDWQAGTRRLNFHFELDAD